MNKFDLESYEKLQERLANELKEDIQIPQNPVVDVSDIKDSNGNKIVDESKVIEERINLIKEYLSGLGNDPITKLVNNSNYWNAIVQQDQEFSGYPTQSTKEDENLSTAIQTAFIKDGQPVDMKGLTSVIDETSGEGDDKQVVAFYYTSANKNNETRFQLFFILNGKNWIATLVAPPMLIKKDATIKV